MSRRGILSRGARATIAVAALYALVLQAFLAGFAPTAAQAHGFAALCAPMQDSGGAPVKHDAKGCCTAACAPFALPPPAPLGATAAWPPRDATLVASNPSMPPPARGPPLDAHSPRGPPLA